MVCMIQTFLLSCELKRNIHFDLKVCVAYVIFLCFICNTFTVYHQLYE